MGALRSRAGAVATLFVAAALFAVAAAKAPGRAAEPPATSLRFEEIAIRPADNGRPFKSQRRVNRAFERIAGWISAVGASGALADIEGTGRPADICLVDPRNDSVSVLPAPGTSRGSALGAPRYAPFALTPSADLVDPQVMAPMGCLPGDFNEDGRTDLLVYYWGRTPIIFLRTGAEGLRAEAFRAVPIGPTGERWHTNAAVSADVDGDGHPDLLFGNYFRDGARVLDSRVGDRVEMQRSMSRARNGGGDRLLLWRSAGPDDVRYEDRSDDALPVQARTGWTLALGARDLTGDLYPELYVANDFGPDHLLLNVSKPGDPLFQLVRGRRDFLTPRSKTLGRDSFKGMGVDFAYLDGSDRPAIAVSNISAPYALIESHHLFVPHGRASAWSEQSAPYRDESTLRGTWISGWGWDIRFADLDNSGRPAIVQAIGFLKGERNRWPELQELAMANDELLRHPWTWPRFAAGDDLSGQDHDRIFAPDRSGRYRDVWPTLGLAGRTVSRGVATGDVYGDGRLAVLIARQWEDSVLLRNRTPGVAGRALVLDVRTPGTVAGDRPAIGAVARVTSNGRSVWAAVDGGSGHSGKSAPEIHVGLGPGAPERDVLVEVRWRDAGGVHCLRRTLRPGRHTMRVTPDLPDCPPPSPARREGKP